MREEGRAKQRIIKNLGRTEIIVASGELGRPAGSVARYAEPDHGLSLESGLREVAGQLFVKQVAAEGRRYIVCRNEAEAEKAAADRRAIVEALERRLKRGDKALIGNFAYRRYLRPTGDRRAFEIDPGELADGRATARPPRRHLRAAEQCAHHATAGGAPLPRSDPDGAAIALG